MTTRSGRRARRALGGALAATLALLALPDAASAGDDVVVIQFLNPGAAHQGGSARARWRDKGGNTFDFNVELQDAPNGSYQLFVAGVPRGASFDVSGGSGEIEFATPQDGAKPLFNFPVFDQTVEVRQGALVRFQGTFGQPGTPSGGGGGGGGGGGTASAERIEVFMVNNGPDPDARGRLRYEETTGKRKFEVDVEDLAAGTYQVYVDGVLEQSFQSTGAEVEMDFEDPLDDSPDPGELELLLDFDPLGDVVEIRSGATIYLAALMPGSSSQTGSVAPTPSRSAVDTGSTRGDSLLVTLLNVGTLTGAQGTAAFSQNGENELEVEIEDVGNATYELFVGGVKRADLVVSGGSGRVKFSSQPGAGELLLNFTVKGALIEVKLLGDTVLGRLFPTDVQSALGRYALETRIYQFRVNLLNAGVDLDATGTAEWRATNGVEALKLDARDLPAGTYRLFVAGVEQGTGAADTRGSLRLAFENKPGSRALPLDFEVLGQTLELRNAAGQTVLEGVVQ